MRDKHEYITTPKPRDVEDLNTLLNNMGAEGYELWPLIHQNGGGGEPYLIFHRYVKVWDTPWDERVDKMLEVVKREIFDEGDTIDDHGEKRLRQVVNFVMNEC